MKQFSILNLTLFSEQLFFCDFYSTRGTVIFFVIFFGLAVNGKVDICFGVRYFCLLKFPWYINVQA
jgi:hypothetical protein